MDAQWLKIQFDVNPNKSKADLARLLGLEPPAISKILSGSRQIKAAEYNSMRQYFGLPVDGEKAALVPDNAYHLETLAGNQRLDDSAEQRNDNWIIPASILDQKTRTPPDQIKIFRIEENFMAPNFKRDEYVLVDLTECTPSPPGAFIVSDGFGNMLRFCEYVPNSDPAEVKVSAASSSFQTQILRLSDFKIIGRVIAKLEWL
ncbi:MAG: hypothetical protein ACPGRX_07550 [Bdellovibrionales bacterium]